MLAACNFQAYAPLGRMKVVANNPVVTSIAESLGKTPAQVALRWKLLYGGGSNRVRACFLKVPMSQG
uniref:NADP-dependent oxidoreductase domain-containing protein n=1 Tax=Setaria viridis TaxID=4556 RepID=A0A4U6SY73_SETVI|nr:hypothetical protein SEVIR_9G201766v2 [Setaria viridis]